MKKFLILSSLILVLSSCQNSTKQDLKAKTSVAKDPTKIIVASYEGGKVYLKEVNDEIVKLAMQNNKLKDLDFYQLTSDQKEALIKEVVLKKLSYTEAKKRDLDEDEDYQWALKNFEAELLKQKLLVDLTKNASDEKNVKKNYDEIISKLKDKKDIQISYIALASQNEANQLYKFLLSSPNSFARVAKNKSLDKETAKKGGDLGFVLEDVIPAEVVKKVRLVKKGEIAEPIQSGDKWLIVKFIDERPAQINSYEKSKDSLAQNLAKKAVEDFIVQSLENSKITIIIK